MKKFLDNHHRWMPVLLLVLCVGTYAVYITRLGFYWDDWMTVFLVDKYKIASKIDYFADRPGFAWLDVITLSLFGLKPLYWHLVFLTIRWLTAWGMWGVLTKIWPDNKEQAAWSAFFFTVYPSFLKQSLAVNYKAQFFSYLCFILSLIFMILAYKKRGYFWQYTIPGMVAALCHLLTTEYIVGLELMRPVIIFLIISPDVLEWKERIKVIVKNWLPYLLMILVFMVRRFIFFPGEVDPNPFIKLNGNGSPVETLVNLVITFLQDVWHVLVTSWSDIVQPEEIITKTPGVLLAWAIAVVTGVVIYFVMRAGNKDEPGEENGAWVRPAILFGMFSIVVGMLPVWLTGRSVLEGGFADRFSIPAMFGASIFVVALVDLLISRRDYQRIVLTLLLVAAISAQIRASNEFRWDWIRQTRAYWQMYWRAPAIEPNTPIIAEGALTGTTNRYNATFAINLLYPQVEGTDSLTYWYFEIPYNGLYRYIPEMLDGMPLTGKYRTEKFVGNSRNSIMIFTPAQGDQCIWFLSPRDIDNNAILEEESTLTPIIDLGRIFPQPFSKDYPRKDIFGPEPQHWWCYYYQKASLAHQYQDWDEVIRLWDEAGRSGFQASFAYELIPFIEAFAYTGNWDQAVKISVDSQEMGLHKNPMLCASWRDMQDTYGGVEAFDLAYSEVSQALTCD
jgi:hypothetical protein